MERSQGNGRLTSFACAMLLALFAILAWRGIVTQSPTVDEPLHAVSAYRAVFDHDFLMNTEDPPLWKYWMMLPHRRGELDAAADTSEIDPVLGGFLISTPQLFQSQKIDGAEFVNRSRYMMLVIGILLGAAIMRWSYELAGPAAAMVAATLFCLDPGFLGHSPLLKNDVAVSLVFCCIAWTTWRIGRNATVWNLVALVLLAGCAATVKFSGLLAGPMVLCMLGLRALMPQSWRIVRLELRSRRSRISGALLITLVCMLFAWFFIWASYGFRFEASTDPRHQINFNAEYEQVASNRQLASSAAAPQPGLPEAIVRFSYDHRLVPESWLFGLLHTYGSSLVRASFLLGEVSETGWWYYFPLTFLFKSPLMTLAATVTTIVLLLIPRNRSSLRAAHWSMICLLAPLLIYGISALRTNLNLGVRHLFPFYAILFILIGVAVSHTMLWVPVSRIRRALIVLGMLLAAETLPAYPHYISFFNIACRSDRLHLLSDSNFDWGQDLKYVAAWQTENPGIKTYLGYWGPADPRFYGIQYTNIPGGFAMGHADEHSEMTEPGVLMISATLLQGVNFPPQTRDYYFSLRERPPEEIVGDTIYLYSWPLPEW